MRTATTSTGVAAAPPMPLEVRLEALASAVVALSGLADSLTDATLEQLAKALGVLDRVAALAAAGRVAVAAARAQRSGGTARRRACQTADWVREHAPSQRGSGAGLVARAAELLDEPGAEPVEEALLGGELSPGVALSVMNAFERVRSRLADPLSAPLVLQSLLDTAERDGVRALNAAVTLLLERYGTADAVQHDQDAAAKRVSLSHGIQEAGGTTRYDLIADALGRAILEAALGPLSRPTPSPDGSPDPRSAEHRRGQALFEVCRRVAHTAPPTEPSVPPRTATNGSSADSERDQQRAQPAWHPELGCPPESPTGADRETAGEPVDDPQVEAPGEPGGEPHNAPPDEPEHQTAVGSPPTPFTGPQGGPPPGWACRPPGLAPAWFGGDSPGEPPPWFEGEPTGVPPVQPGGRPPPSFASNTGGPPPNRSSSQAPQLNHARMQQSVPRAADLGLTSLAEVPTGVKTILFLSMTLADLGQCTGAAVSVGPVGYGSQIAAGTARRLACDAGIIPVVLGSHGEILDLGRQSRLFSYAQVKALWLRDKHCTYPGCDVPPFWTDAHHLRHWVDGGVSDLSNAALLCGRHHDTVHHDKLAGTVRPDGTGVDWNLTPGSYQPTEGAEIRF